MTSPLVLVPSRNFTMSQCSDSAATPARAAAARVRLGGVLRSVGAALRFELTLSDQLLGRTGVGASPRR